MNLPYIFAGKRIARLMKEGKFASAAHLIKRGFVWGVFEDVRDWRTAALLFIPIDLRSKPKPKRFATSRWEGIQE